MSQVETNLHSNNIFCFPKTSMFKLRFNYFIDVQHLKVIFLTFSCFWMSSHFSSASILSFSSSSSDFFKDDIDESDSIPLTSFTFFFISSSSFAFLKKIKNDFIQCWNKQSFQVIAYYLDRARMQHVLEWSGLSLESIFKTLWYKSSLILS